MIYIEFKYSDGSIRKEWFNKEGECHRVDGPEIPDEAFMTYRESRYFDGSIQKEWFDEKEEYHRVDGPAVINHNKHGLVNFERFYINGILHREDGPASITYWKDGPVHYKQYFINGKLQRFDGPAHIIYAPSGSITGEYFVIFGEFIGHVNQITFWKFWDMLTESQRKNQNIMKLLLRYS